MRNWLYVALSVLILSGNGCTTVEPGYAGIKVYNTGTKRGIQDYPIRLGRVWYNPITQDVYKFPTFMQNYIWTADEREGSPGDDSFTVNDVDGAMMNFDVGFSVSFEMDSVPKLFVTFRKDADHIISTFLKNELRNALGIYAGRHKVIDLIGVGKQAWLDSVTTRFRQEMSPYGIELGQLSIVGQVRVDEKVQSSINAVLTQAQRANEAENKVREIKAQADQAIEQARGDSASAVIRATGQAEANRKMQLSLTPELIEYNKILKWNGTLPQVTGGTSIVDLRIK